MDNISEIPSVNRLLTSEQGVFLKKEFGHQLTVKAIQKELEAIRNSFTNQTGKVPEPGSILDSVKNQLQGWTRSSLFPVINASGVIIHTNLGRSPLSAETLKEISKVSQGYSSLEFDIDTGGRGSRLIHAEKLFQQFLGVEAALVVNNNAAAVLLILSTLARNKKVIISRSQLVEIGGGFRIPDVMKQSGAMLVEVGTTNRVHLTDYQQAIDPDIVAVMRAHYSNFSIVGFTSEPELADIAEIAHENGLWLFDDLGSGALLDTEQYGLKHEPMVQESLSAGADLVCFSGDKLLGGPQAGIILGKKELINQLKKHPLARAIRADKIALAALSRTIVHYLVGEAEVNIPVWKMISADINDLKERAYRWQTELNLGEVIDAESMVGGGSLPGETLPTFALALSTEHAQTLTRKLRKGIPAVISRIENERVLFDPRTVRPEQDKALINAIKSSWS